MAKKVYIKLKILINGLFPITNFCFEDFTFKNGKYDESVINTENKDFIFYSSGHLLNSCYGLEGKKGNYYNYFENENYIELEMDEVVYNNRDRLNDFVLKNMSGKIESMEKRLRLITNFNIGLPILKATVYDENQKILTYVGISSHQTSYLNISKYTDDMKKLLTNRLRFRISDSTIYELEKNNSRYKRAMLFYNNSFLTNDIGVRFVLLFSSIESLFNINGQDVADIISKNTSRIMFVSPKKTKQYYFKIKNLYDIRSKYIHGNEPRIITEKIEFDLREIVREVLLMYWYISQWENIKNEQQIISFLEKNDKDSLDLSIQLFKKSLYITDYQAFYQETITKLVEGQTNLLND